MNTTKSAPHSPSRNRTSAYAAVALASTLLAAAAVAQTQDPLKKENPAAYARAAAMKTAGNAQPPRLIALRVHHDMCPYCKQMKPELKTVMDDSSAQRVLWITLDLTTEQTQRQSAMLLAALGLAEHWTGDMTPMGTVTFIGASSRKPLTLYRPGMETTLAGALQAALDKAPD